MGPDPYLLHGVAKLPGFLAEFRENGASQYAGAIVTANSLDSFGLLPSALQLLATLICMEPNG